ncbi:hypothetical protein ACHAQH_006231 [Verticillium albo-atrum]
MSGSGSALVSESGNWPDSTTAFTFEDIFVLPENEDPNSSIGLAASDRDKPPQKLLACARCHAQKLRCVRQHQNSRVCDRCFGANAECIRRQPQRMGRPLDWGGNNAAGPGVAQHARVVRRKTAADHPRAARAVSPRSQTQTQFRRQHRNGSSHTNSNGNGNGNGNGNANSHASDNGNAAAGIRSSGADLATLSHSSTTNLHMVDQWIWPSPPRDSASLTPSNTDDAHTREGDSSGSSPAAPVSGGPSAAAASVSYGGPIIAGLGGLDLLLPNFDDVSNDLLRAEPETSHSGLRRHSRSAAQSTATGEPGRAPAVAPPSDGDQVEQLTKFHLELYQCLNLVKAIKTQKETLHLAGQPSKDYSDGPVDSSWMEEWFRTTERFIKALQSHSNDTDTGHHEPSAAENAPTGTGTARESPPSRASHRAPSPEMDTSTGLMIVSCYTRLLQVLEVVVALALVYRQTDCPGAMVQVRFGAFFPAADKMLHIRLVLQYILHLLDGASGAVSQAVASRPMCASALADIHVVEAKLKGRISAALN